MSINYTIYRDKIYYFIPVEQYSGFNTDRVYHKYLEDRIEKSLTLLGGWPMDNEAENYIKNTDILINDFYQGDKPREMFHIYLESENYYDDIGKLFRNSLLNIRPERDKDEKNDATRAKIRLYMMPSENIVTKDRKFMYSIASEFYTLKNRDKKLAHKIKDYILSEYDKKYPKTMKLLHIWDECMELYNDIKNGIEIAVEEEVDRISDSLAEYGKESGTSDVLTTADILIKVFECESDQVAIYADIDQLLICIQFFNKALRTEIYEDKR